MKSWARQDSQHVENSSNSTLGFFSPLFLKCQASLETWWLTTEKSENQTGKATNTLLLRSQPHEWYLLWLMVFRVADGAGVAVFFFFFLNLTAKCPLKLTL